jgi:hypothetical protein
MPIKLNGETSGSIELDVPAAVSGGDISFTLPNGVGSANQILKNSGTAGTLEYGTAGLKSIQVFSAGSSTWTKPSGITRVRVYVTGGGGPGGKIDSDDMANGGGAGGTAIKLIDVTSISSVDVTVGAGGVGTQSILQSASARGGTSSFGTHCSATGGDRTGGQWGIGGDGGTATGGDINISGSDGIGGLIDNTSNWQAAGTGGASFWGQGGKGSTNSFSAKANGEAFGSGGGGGAGGGSFSTDSVSANGAPGIVVVEEYA